MILKILKTNYLSIKKIPITFLFKLDLIKNFEQSCWNS